MMVYVGVKEARVLMDLTAVVVWQEREDLLRLPLRWVRVAYPGNC